MTLPLPSIELFTSKCLVEFFSGSSRQARGQSCPTLLSLAGRGWSWAGKDWKAAYLLSASASVVEGSHHTPSLDKGRRLGPDCGDLDRCTQAVISLCLECRLPPPFSHERTGKEWFPTLLVLTLILISMSLTKWAFPSPQTSGMKTVAHSCSVHPCAPSASHTNSQAQRQAHCCPSLRLFDR